MDRNKGIKWTNTTRNWRPWDCWICVG